MLMAYFSFQSVLISMLMQAKCCLFSFRCAVKVFSSTMSKLYVDDLKDSRCGLDCSAGEMMRTNTRSFIANLKKIARCEKPVGFVVGYN
jgi:hypothetical protein